MNNKIYDHLLFCFPVLVYFFDREYTNIHCFYLAFYLYSLPELPRFRIASLLTFYSGSTIILFSVISFITL